MRPGSRLRPRGLVTDPPLLGRHQDGDSFLHRAPAGPKLLGLAVLALGAGIVRSSAPPAAAALTLLALAVAVAAVARGAGLGTRYLLAQLRRLWWVLLALGVVQTWLLGPLRATGVLAALVTCLWAAATVTGTTPVPVLLDAVVDAVRPLRRFGVDTDGVGLALVLATTSVPVVTGLLRASRETAAARGLDRDPRAVLVPTLVRTVAHAEALSEALAARGLDQPAPGEPPPDGPSDPAARDDVRR